VDSFSKNTHIPNLMKILPLGAELLYAKRRRVMTKLTVACNNSANTGEKRKNNETTSCTTTLEEMVLSLVLVVKSNVFFKPCQHHKRGGDLCHRWCKSWETWRLIRSILMWIFGSFHKQDDSVTDITFAVNDAADDVDTRAVIYLNDL